MTVPMTKRLLQYQTRIDIAVALIAAVVEVVLFVVAFQSIDGRALPDWATVAIAVCGAAMLAGRRQRPLVVLVIVVSARALLIVDAEDIQLLNVAVVVALYSAARHTRRPAALGVAAVAVLLSATLVAAVDVESVSFFRELLAEAAITALPVAVGFGLRQRAERVKQLIDNEANARVQAERLRIARDLHDIVAHGLSSMTIQAGVAAHLLDEDPTVAKDALEGINATGKVSLEELRGMVGVLRSTDDNGYAPLHPTPASPNDLTRLLALAERDQLKLTKEICGTFPPEAGNEVVVAFHRIVGEALTNAARHAGPVPVEFTVSHSEGEVMVRVANAKPAGRNKHVASTGVGIEGMTERAAAVGGTLTAGPTADGGFAVQAWLPYSRRDR